MAPVGWQPITEDAWISWKNRLNRVTSIVAPSAVLIAGSMLCWVLGSCLFTACQCQFPACQRTVTAVPKFKSCAWPHLQPMHVLAFAWLGSTVSSHTRALPSQSPRKSVVIPWYARGLCNNRRSCDVLEVRVKPHKWKTCGMEDHTKDHEPTSTFGVETSNWKASNEGWQGADLPTAKGQTRAPTKAPTTKAPTTKAPTKIPTKGARQIARTHGSTYCRT